MIVLEIYFVWTYVDQPLIITPLDTTTIVIHEGMSRTFACKATGYPIPTITWHRVGEPSTDGVSMSENITGGSGSTANLVIRNASREDTGVYTCTANNSIGSDNRNISIVGMWMCYNNFDRILENWPNCHTRPIPFYWPS